MEANPLKVLSSETKKGQPERWKEIPKIIVSGKHSERISCSQLWWIVNNAAEKANEN